MGGLFDPKLRKSRPSLPKSAQEWSTRTFPESLIKVGARVARHARYVIFLMAEVLVSRSLFHEILMRIGRLKPVPVSISESFLNKPQ